MGKHYHLAQLGTYDIESLGDTMFPRALEYGLGQRFEDFDVDLYSLHACEHPYNGLSPVHALTDLKQEHGKCPYDALVIGGGEFLTFDKIKILINGELICYPEGWLWRNTIEEAQSSGINVIINCVGMPKDIDSTQQKNLRESLSYAKLIAVRDDFSKARLDAAGLKDAVHVVPDNLWMFSRMYDKELLNAKRNKLSEFASVDFDEPYLVVQYGTTRDLDMLAQELKKIQRRYGLKAFLMPVNYTHDDLSYAQALNERAKGAFTILEYHMQPLEMISVIAGATGFIGTSFHGNLIAASYGVPFVGIDMYPDTVSKMDGLFTMLDLERFLCPREVSVASTFEEAFRTFDKEKVQRTVSTLQARLDEHFDEMAKVITSR